MTTKTKRTIIGAILAAAITIGGALSIDTGDEPESDCTCVEIVDEAAE